MPSVTRDKASQQQQSGGKTAAESQTPAPLVEDTRRVRSVKTDPALSDPFDPTSSRPTQQQQQQQQLWGHPSSQQPSSENGPALHARRARGTAHRANQTLQSASPNGASVNRMTSLLGPQRRDLPQQQEQGNSLNSPQQRQHQQQPHQRGQSLHRSQRQVKAAQQAPQQAAHNQPQDTTQQTGRIAGLQDAQEVSHPGAPHVQQANQSHAFAMPAHAQHTQFRPVTSQLPPQAQAHATQAEQFRQQQQQQVEAQEVATQHIPQLQQSSQGSQPGPLRHGQPLPQTSSHEAPQLIEAQRPTQVPLRRQNATQQALQSQSRRQQQLQPSLQGGAQQYAHVQHLHQEAQRQHQGHSGPRGQQHVQQIQQAPQFQRMHRPIQPQITSLPPNDPNFQGQSASEFDHRYRSHNAQQPSQKDVAHTARVQGRQQSNLGPHQQHQQQQQQQKQEPHIATGAFAVGQAVAPPPAVATNPIARNIVTDPSAVNGSMQGSHLYSAALGLNPGVLSVSGGPGMQYANQPHGSAGLFDPLSLNQGALPLTNVAMGQTAQSQAVSVVRDLERSGQQPRMQQQNQGRPSMQVSERNGVLASELQGYGEQGQQPVMHAGNVQGHAPQELHGQALSQQAVPHGLYHSLDHQQVAQHLVLSQNAAFAQQQGRLAMHSQTGQVQHHPNIRQHEGQYGLHQGYQHHQHAHVHPPGSADASHQVGEVQARKPTTTGAPQELVWGHSNSNGRMIPNGLAQHPSTDMGGVAQGAFLSPHFVQSHLFEMGIPDVRQSTTQNGVPQASVQSAAQNPKAQRGQTYASSVKRMSSGAGAVSPRKRRQLSNAVASSVLDSSAPGRMFSCSGCGQDFARKRDRDLHVRSVHDRSFSCDKCTACFKTKSDANRHKRIVHDRVRPYACPSCPSMFSERNKLRRHKETVHEKLRPYVCPVCSARFGELGNLRQHTGSLHPDYQVDSAPGSNGAKHQVQS